MSYIYDIYTVSLQASQAATLAADTYLGPRPLRNLPHVATLPADEAWHQVKALQLHVQIDVSLSYLSDF